MIRPFNLKDMGTEQENLVFLSEQDVKEKGLDIFAADTLLFARVGDVGCGLLTHARATISPNIIAVELNRTKVNPIAAVCFFNTKYGLVQLEREIKAVAQPTISTYAVSRFRIPEFTEFFAKQLEIRYRRAKSLEQVSHDTYAQADRILLTELGLLDWQPPQSLSYIRKLSEAFAEGRLDAEHYRPRYDMLLALLKAKGDLRLGDHLTEDIQRGISPEYSEDGDVMVINSQHVGKMEVELDNNRYTRRQWLNAQKGERGEVRKGDVLLNSTGYITIGRCQCLLEEVNAVVDNHVAIIRPKPGLDPIYLACFLNTLPGQMQTERGWTGSSGQIELRRDVVADYRIWNAPGQLQKKVRAHIEQSHSKRREARLLLERVKRAVEIAIEESEVKALAFLNSDLEL